MNYYVTKDASNEVTYDVPNYFNVFNISKGGRKLLNWIDVSYKRVCMKIQSTIINSAHSNSEEQIDAISNSKEHVDAISNSGELFGTVCEGKIIQRLY